MYATAGRIGIAVRQLAQRFQRRSTGPGSRRRVVEMQLFSHRNPDFTVTRLLHNTAIRGHSETFPYFSQHAALSLRQKLYESPRKINSSKSSVSIPREGTKSSHPGLSVEKPAGAKVAAAGGRSRFIHSAPRLKPPSPGPSG